MKKTAAIVALMMMATASGAFAADIDPMMRGNDAGAQLQNAMDLMERARVARQIEEDMARRQAKTKEEKQQVERAKAPKVEFVVQKFEYEQSQVLSNEKLAALMQQYTGRVINLDDLNEMVDKINAMYDEGAYLTCRAILPPQKVTGGVVKIQLVEGKIGKVTVSGNKDTKTPYITRRVPFKPGQILSRREMEKRLGRFNGTNDAALRVALKPGETFGTTDFEIQVVEPQKINHTLLIDNAGNQNSGEYRYGYFMNVRSLSGVRDSITAGTIISKGTKAWSGVYEAPIGPSGTKISLAYSGNSVKMIDGELHDSGVDTVGHSCAYSVALRQPWVVNDTTRTEVGLEFNHQSSYTEMRAEGQTTTTLVDDRIRDLSPYFSHTDYGKSHIFYQKHSFAVYGNYHSGLTSDSSAAPNDVNHMHYYKFNGLYQKYYQHRQAFNLRVDAQWTNSNLPSSRDFFIGGMNSVRGYKESFIAGDKGFLGSVEYQVPISKDYKHNAFCFWDYGWVSDSTGSDTFNDHILQSVGVGIKSSWTKHLYSNLSIGFPLLKNINSTEVGKTRVHFLVSGFF